MAGDRFGERVAAYAPPTSWAPCGCARGPLDGRGVQADLPVAGLGCSGSGVLSSLISDTAAESPWRT